MLVESAPIATPTNRSQLEDEVSGLRPVTRVQDLDIYLFTATTSPALMREVGRLREVEFRRDGGGTGKQLDIDRYDDPTSVGSDAPEFRQLVAWDSEHAELVAMYRFLPGWCVNPQNYEHELPTGHLFEYSPGFLSGVLPHTVELGRSVVNREARKRMKGLFAIWAGLGALVNEYPQLRYFFGKVTVYPQMNPEARSLIYGFLAHWFPDPDRLLWPRVPVPMQNAAEPWSDLPSHEEDLDKDLGRLVESVSALGATVPPLILSYSRLTPFMRSCGTAVNRRFGNVEETAILVPTDRLRPKIRTRFIDIYESVNPEAFLV